MGNVSRTKTTLDLPDELLIAAKKKGAEQRRPLRVLVEETLRVVLADYAFIAAFSVVRKCRKLFRVSIRSARRNDPGIMGRARSAADREFQTRSNRTAMSEDPFYRDG